MAGGSSEAVKCPSGSKTSLPPRPKKVQRRSSQRPRAIRLRRLRLQFPGGGGGGLREWGGVSVGLYACFKYEAEDAADDEEDDASVTHVDSITDVNPSGSKVSVGTKGQRFLPDVSDNRTSGSSRESGLAIGTNDGCNVSATPSTVPQSLTPTTVATQTQEGEERDGEKR